MKTKFWIICLSAFFVSCLRNMHDIYTGGGEEGEEKINKDDFLILLLSVIVNLLLIMV